MNQSIRLINRYPMPTPEAIDLKQALEKNGVRVYIELDDGHKHIDLTIPRAKINVEIDGVKHLLDHDKILADLSRDYYSHLNGYDTMHISNEMIHKHLPKIAYALAEASKIRERKMHIHLS